MTASCGEALVLNSVVTPSFLLLPVLVSTGTVIPVMIPSRDQRVLFDSWLVDFFGILTTVCYLSPNLFLYK